MKQLALAVANYHEVNGSYPPAYEIGPDGRPWHSWRVLILPYIEQNELFREYDFCEPWDGPNNRKLADRMPRIYALHEMHQPGNVEANYLVVVGDETVWPGANTRSHAEVTDAPSETVLMVENLGAGVHWMEPRDLSFSEIAFNRPNGISSQYNDPAVAMVDGSLYRLTTDLSPATLRGLMTIRGGEKLSFHGPGGWQRLPDGRRRPLRNP